MIMRKRHRAKIFSWPSVLFIKFEKSLGLKHFVEIKVANWIANLESWRVRIALGLALEKQKWHNMRRSKFC